MNKLNIVQSILLFIFGIICLYTIEACYHDYIYSEQKVILRLSYEFEEKSQEYTAFFDYTQNLRDSIKWDTLELRLEEVKYNIDQETHLNFNLFPEEAGGFSYDGLRGSIVSLPDIKIPINEDTISESIKKDIGLTISQLNKLRNYLTELDECEFRLYKDGSVVINKSIGPELFNMAGYQIIRPGERIFLYGNFWNTYHENIFIGRTN